MPSRYPEIKVAGPPQEMGRQIGEAARDAIRDFVAVALERVNKTVAISRDRAAAIAADSTKLAAVYAPDSIAELLGMAEGAGVSLDDLMLLQVRNQFTPQADNGCTSFSIGSSAQDGSGAVVGQNWDNDPALDRHTVVLTRRPTGKPALTTVTQAGLIAYIGFNEAGIGACLNTLPAPSRAVGVPHYFTLRAIYETTTLDDAAAAVRRAHRAIPANIMLATPQGPADLEVTLDDVYVLRDGGDGIVTHTNHCLHPGLVSINDQFEELIESRPRKRRIDEMLALSSDAQDIESLKAVLRDHQGYPKSICRHANDHPQHGFWETVFSVIIEPAARRMHIARGTPCDHPFETYCMD